MINRNIRFFLEELFSGNRSTLAQAITAIESSHKTTQQISRNILDQVFARNFRKKRPAFKIGLCGSPGAGKSTFLERFGQLLIEQQKIAILTIDPSSQLGGGSLLADKTRMPSLSSQPAAFIRSSPSAGRRGGISQHTFNAIALCEAAGYDVIFVETVGIGQTEVAIADVVDMLCVLVAPASGDHLQALKKGVMEYADLVVINKSDGHLVAAARRQQIEFMSALRDARPVNPLWKPKVLRVSSMSGDGMPEVWETMERYRSEMESAGILKRKQTHQVVQCFQAYVEEGVLERIRCDPGLQKEADGYENELCKDFISPVHAAHRLLEHLKVSIEPGRRRG